MLTRLSGLTLVLDLSIPEGQSNQCIMIFVAVSTDPLGNPTGCPRGSHRKTSSETDLQYPPMGEVSRHESRPNVDPTAISAVPLTIAVCREGSRNKYRRCVSGNSKKVRS